jgi:hypothetical protein
MTRMAWPPPAVAELIDSDPRFEPVPADPTYTARIVEGVGADECDLALYAASRRHRTDDELRALAQDNVRLVDHARSVLGLAPREELVPTESNVRAFLERGPT